MAIQELEHYLKKYKKNIHQCTFWEEKINITYQLNTNPHKKKI